MSCTVLVAGGLVLAAACNTVTDADISLDQIADPDTNSVAVVMSRDVFAEGVALQRGVEYIYVVRGDRSPHTLLAERIVQDDTMRLMFVISDLYTAGGVQTDGTLNRFSWTAPDGTQYEPASRCLLDVTQPYSFGTPSVQRVQTACEVMEPGGNRLTLYAKAARYEQLGG